MSQHGCPGRVGRSHVHHAHREPGADGSRPTTARTASRAQTVAVPRHVTIAVPVRAPLPRGQEYRQPRQHGGGAGPYGKSARKSPAAARAGPHPQAGGPGPACKQRTRQNEQRAADKNSVACRPMASLPASQASRRPHVGADQPCRQARHPHPAGTRPRLRQASPRTRGAIKKVAREEEPGLSASRLAGD